MSTRLVGVRLKTCRAYQHLKHLADDIQRVMMSGSSDGVFSDFNGKQGEWIVRAVVPPIRDAWPLIVGDCVHNIRSALDHLAWQLVLLAGKQPTSRTEFPIFKDSKLFEKYAGAKMEGMPDEARALIEQAQPYHTKHKAAEADDLWLIQELCNIDKHRRLHLSQITIIGGRCVIKLPSGAKVQKVEEFAGGPLQGTTILAHYRWDPSPLPPNGKVDMEIKLSFDVTFAKAPLEGPPVVNLEGTGVRQLLIELLDYVRETIVPTFEPLFS